MSIFEKDCPQCASPNPVHAVSCRCGYCFEPEATDETYRAQQERLYRDYLAARLVQAEAALKVARAEAAADPENQVKAAQALLAEQALNSARAELRAHAPSANRTRPAPRTPPAPSRKPSTPMTSSSPSATTRPAAPVAAPSTSLRAEQPVTLPAANNKASDDRVSAKPALRGQPATPRATAKPGPLFRAVQTVKAEAAVQARKTAPKRLSPKTVTRSLATGTHATNAAATRTPAKTPPSPARAKAANPPRKECPHCTALLPLEAVRCRCGFSLPTVTAEMPAVALDAETLALLAHGLDLGSR